MGNCNSEPSKYQSESAKGSAGSDSRQIEEQEDACSTVVHQGSIMGLSSYQGGIVSCSDDRRIARFMWCLRPLPTGVGSCNHGESNIQYFSGHSKSVNRIVGSDNYLWSASRDLSVRQWNSNGECIKEFKEAHTLNIAALCIPKDESYIFSGSRDYSVKGWNVLTGQCEAEFKAPRNIVTTLDVHPIDDHLIFQGSEDLCVRVWDFKSKARQPAMHLTGYVYFPLSLSIHPNGHYFATGCKGFDGTGCEVKIWDIRTTKVLKEAKEHMHDVTACKFTPDGCYLLSASKDGSIAVWDFQKMTATAGSTAGMVALLASTGKYFTSLEIVYNRADDHAVTTDSSTSSCAQNTLLEFVAGAYDGSVSFYRVVAAPANAIKKLPYAFVLVLQTRPHYAGDSMQSDQTA